MNSFLAEPFKLAIPMENPLLLPPLTLAYIGDSLYELFVRHRLIALGHVRVGDLHKTAIRYVRAREQAAALTAIMPLLSELEQDVVRRGRNAKGHAAPKSSDAAEYGAATSFETLLGYLYLAGSESRLHELLNAAVESLENK